MNIFHIIVVYDHVDNTNPPVYFIFDSRNSTIIYDVSYSLNDALGMLAWAYEQDASTLTYQNHPTNISINIYTYDFDKNKIMQVYVNNSIKINPVELTTIIKKQLQKQSKFSI
ncbi:hypothetical protein D3M71_18140 [Erwinia billingiae]|nr:hypothetical protein [Erwinia billingiae]